MSSLAAGKADPLFAVGGPHPINRIASTWFSAALSKREGLELPQNVIPIRSSREGTSLAGIKFCFLELSSFFDLG